MPAGYTRFRPVSHRPPDELARELLSAYATGQVLATPSSREDWLDLAAAYAVEAEVVRLRREQGRTTVGRKVGFANKALWRVLKLDTLVWAHMYDDTVKDAPGNRASHSLEGRYAPRIEPEIVFKLAKPVESGGAAPTAVLEAVEWMALGFEINDCLFPDWKFRPVDFVASFGLHTALIVGQRRPVEPPQRSALAEALSRFRLKLMKGDELVEEGSGRAVLRSPALCLGELADALARQPDAEPLAAGEIVSTGTITTPQPVAAGETWRAQVEGIDLPELTVEFS